MIANFSIAIMESRAQWNIYKKLRVNNWHPRTVWSTKLSSKIEDKIYNPAKQKHSFSPRDSLKGLVITFLKVLSLKKKNKSWGVKTNKIKKNNKHVSKPKNANDYKTISNLWVKKKEGEENQNINYDE